MSADNDKRLLDRTDWIKQRSEVGFDWSELVGQMAQVVVEYSEDGVVVDASAISTDDHMPCRFVLEPGAGGLWLHDETGECAHLVEHLWVITMMVTGHKYEPPEVSP